MHKAKVLYLSYDGMTDPLGRSQVIPYLRGLAEAGYGITVLSSEKEDNFKTHEKRVVEIFNAAGIRWIRQRYVNIPPVIAPYFGVWRMKKEAETLHRENHYELIHCRAHLTALIGLYLKRKYGTRFLFDMRGFMADERAESGLWDLRNPVFHMIYKYFKKKEKEFLAEADYTVCLTEKAKKIIHGWPPFGVRPIPVRVIPCCADMKHFSCLQFDESSRRAVRKKSGICENVCVICYLGSVGTWYLPFEMMCFFKRLLLKRPDARFLWITPHPAKKVLLFAEKAGVPSERIIVKKASYAEIPALLSICNLSVFFIKPVFSKSASSPTKQAEIMSMGIPLVCNAGIGDTDEILEKSRSGILVRSFDDASYDKALEEMDSLLSIPPDEIRKAAEKYFSLSEGIQRYLQVYDACIKP